MKNHLTLGIYGNKTYTYNVVRDEDLEYHIYYNLTYRPGRLLYVDGKRLNKGMIKEEYLGPYDEIAKEFYAKADRINMNVPTIPYD